MLAEHQRLLRAAFAAHDGHEVDTQGDSFFVAFASARDAVLAALDGQRALLSHPWPEGVVVEVRMGLHTGQAAASNGRYTGLAVHRAARIGAAGHGGQVLVSQATQALIEDEEEDLPVTLLDLGEQRLKDLDRPVRLYQATGDGMPTSFPPVRDAAEPSAVGGRRPAWRRPVSVVAAAVVAIAAVAGVVLLTRDSSGGLAGVRPNHVGVIDPASNEILAEVPVGIRPGLVAGGAGSVWVGNLDDRTLTRIDAAERTSSATIGLERRTPTGLAVGAGEVWVAHGLAGSLSRVDPAFNQVSDALPIADPSLSFQSGAVTFGAGSVWVVFGDATLAQVDPRAMRVSASGLAGSRPSAIAFGAGLVWVANTDDHNVQGFSPASLGPVRNAGVGLAPTGIAFGGGSVWVANSADDTVTRIDPSTGSTRTIEVGEGPASVAFGDGAVWVACTAARAVVRIDPTTNDVAATIGIGNAPVGVAVEHGHVWVAVQEP